MAATNNHQLFDQTVGRNLQRMRAAAGLSQQALADEMKAWGHTFRQQTVMNIEKGSRPLRHIEVLHLAEILSVDVADFHASPEATVLTAARRLDTQLLHLGMDLSMLTRAIAQLPSQIAEVDGDLLPEWVHQMAVLEPDQVLEIVGRVSNLGHRGLEAAAEED